MVAFCGSGHIIWVASLEGNNLVVFYYLGPPEIWLVSMVAFCGSGHIIWVVSLEGNNLVIFYYIYYMATPTKSNPYYARFQMDRHSKILLNYFPQERQPILYGHSHKKRL
jgi:hypothetical protein